MSVRLLTFLCVLFSLSSLAQQASGEKKQWTYLFFVAGDEEDIDPWSRVPLRELEQLGSDANRWLVAHVDLNLSDDGKIQVDGPSRRYVLNKFPGPIDGKDFSTLKIQSPVVWESSGETNSAASDALRDFLGWAVERYPAEHYALFILGHSWGWRGIAQDYRPGFALPASPEAAEIDFTMASSSEMAQAIVGGLPTGKKLDLVVMDTCHGGVLELAYELRDLAKYFVGSSTEMSFNSFDYAKSLSADSSVEIVKSLVRDLLPTFVRGGSMVQQEGEYPALALFALDLERMPTLWAVWEQLTRELKGSNFSSLFLGNKVSDWLDAGWSVDWAELLGELAEKSDKQSVRALASSLKRLLTGNIAPSPDSLWMDLPAADANELQVTMLADELARDKAIERARDALFYMNPRLRWTPNEWGQPTDDPAKIVAKFTWEGGESLRIRPTIPGGNWAKMTLKKDGQTLHERVFTHPTGYEVVTDYPLGSPYLATGHTLGAGRSQGIALSLDTVVDPKLPASYHLTKDGSWLGGRAYYRSIAFAQAFGWADLIFAERPYSGPRPSYRNRSIRQR